VDAAPPDFEERALTNELFLSNGAMLRMPEYGTVAFLLRSHGGACERGKNDLS
jgi:hypothetical protein